MLLWSQIYWDIEKLNDIMVTKLTYEKDGNSIDYIYYSYTIIYIDEQELEGKIK